MRRRRCLIPADGFYEWKEIGEPQAALFRAANEIRRADRLRRPVGNLDGPNGEEMDTAAIVTTKANRTLAALHDRMPVILPPEAFDLWLDTAKVDAQTAAALLVPAPDDLVEAYEVSPAVNRVANDDARLIEPLPPGAARSGRTARGERAAHGRESESVGQKQRRADIILGPLLGSPERPFRPFPRAGSVHANVAARAMIHGEVVKKFVAFSPPPPPNPHRLNGALQGRAPGNGSGFQQRRRQICRPDIETWFFSPKRCPGRSFPSCLFGATRFPL